MFGPKELDIKNIYNPNLADIQESAERTYGEANCFFRKEELYLNDIANRLASGENFSDKEIYDICHAIASDLAKCCEMYLKALYIYENNISGNLIDDLWSKLKNTEFKSDSKGNLLYQTPNGIITRTKYDSNGNPVYDNNGKIVYVDDSGNTYTENSRGAKIKMNGHQLDRLIDLLSPESKLLLETRMLTIPMNITEENRSISILDLLQEKGVLAIDEKITQAQYSGWLEQHKKTFEEARYSGQQNSVVNIEFLFHLTTQIKAVAQYKIDPKNNQKFSITDAELAKLPSEIQNIAASHSHFLSQELIKLIVSDEEAKDKIKELFSKQYILPKSVSSNNFYDMIKNMSREEIIYMTSLCYIVDIYDKLDISNDEKNIKNKYEKIFKVAGTFNTLKLSPNSVLELGLRIKNTTNTKLGNDLFLLLLAILSNNNLNLEFITRLVDFYTAKILNNQNTILKENLKI